MKFLENVFTVILFSAPLFGQAQNPAQYNAVDPNQDFYEDFLDFSSGESGKTRVDIFIQVPYTNIQFIKSDEGFSGGYTVTISVFDKDKEKLIAEKSWTEKINVKEFEQTTSKNNFNLSLRSFFLEPDKYSVRSAIEDMDSKKSAVKEDLISVKNMLNSFSVSDIMLIAKETIVNGNNKIVPNVSKNVALQNEKEGLQFFFEICSDSPKKIEIEYSLIEGNEEAIKKDTVIKNVDSGKTQILHSMNNLQLGMGEYLIKADILDTSGNAIGTTEKVFISRWIGVPSTVKDIDKAVDEMVYIASGSEMSDIKDAANKDEKLKQFLDFWKKKDPTPQTDDNPVFEEYYRRVEYANKNFSHYLEGWRTDRGMVFIILGSPNNVDRHPFEYDSKPYEVWEYYQLNKYFVFVDETGFGDYRLSTPLYGDFYRYR
ncbi:MAG TPA: GWxTD domain-containing protein [Ignavibacteriaceae bacterium]|nr:GWxTD domain-containing protein [Ignavibacteriaceae bacterium]